MSSIPTISLSQTNTEQLSKALLDACTDTGFFYLTDIPIDERLIASAWVASESLFLDESQDGIAAKLKSRNREAHTGYTAVHEEKLAIEQNPVESTDSSTALEEEEETSQTPGDLKESFYIARLNVETPQQLPPVLQQHQKDLNQFFEQCKGVCSIVMKALAIALGLDVDFFASRHKLGNDDRLRLIHYPPTEVPEAGSNLNIRAGSHSDYGMITLLFQRGVSGLQVLDQHSEDKSVENWIDIPPKKGAIVINVGDALEFWTSGVLQSTQHRVVMPRTEAETVSRFSIAYFSQPDSDASLEPLTNIQPIKSIQKRNEQDYLQVLQRKGIHPDIKVLTGGQHLQSRLKTTFAT